LNAIHPFREGNGRTQLSFLTVLAEQAGHPIEFAQLDPKAMLNAAIRSFDGDEQPLAALIRRLIA
jgi:cell filamentation protein